MDRTINVWSFIHAILMIGALMVSVIAGEGLILLLVAVVSFLGYVLFHGRNMLRLFPLGGAANWITAFRLGLLLFTGVQIMQLSPIVLIVCLTLFFILDFVDGWVATKWNHRSVFGQFFDMESDALFVLMMCFYYYSVHGLPPWILIPGLLRYLYKIVLEVLPKEGFQERKQKYAAYIAGVFIVDLILCLLLKGDLQYILLLVGTILILGSFSISFVDYFKYSSLRLNEE